MVSISRHHAASSLLWLALPLWVATVNAQQSVVQPSFVWGFMNLPSTTLELPECAQLQMFVNPSGGPTAPKPPYSLIAYEVGGIPTVQSVGSELNNLFWTVDHASQSQLVLSMVDAVGNAGGISPSLYTVVPGSGTTCHASNRTSPVSLTTNSTKSIATCDVLTFKMSGGTKPYTISIAPISKPITFNFTLVETFDTLDWVNRAAPDTQIIISASDSNGVYANSTNLIATSGTTDTTCGNQPSSTASDSTSKSSANQTPSTSSSANNSSSKPLSTTALVGIIVSGVVISGLTALSVLLYLRRRRDKARLPERYDIMGTNNDSGLGGILGLGGRDRSSIAAEIEPFVLPDQPSTRYTDNPRYIWTVNSAPPLNMNLGPQMLVQQGPTLQKNVASTVLSPPPSSSLSSFDPHGMARTPFSTLGIAGPWIVEPPVGAAYAAYDGLTAESYPRMAEAGPSTEVLAVANPATLNKRQGPLPPLPIQSVYQHEDISDVVELPPAYKTRTDPSVGDL